MTTLDYKEFNQIYQESVSSILKFWTPAMQSELAVHCHGWSTELFDFKTYLRASSQRFYRAYTAFGEDERCRTICDIGGFWGVFPLTLKSLGYDVTMTEATQYYSSSFDGLFRFIEGRGVRIIDFDPFQPDARLAEKFDLLSIMAVLEHYPHSLKVFMDNVVSMLKTDGRLYIEVPNIAFWPKRVDFLFGHSPLTSLRQIYLSASPFIGHHHEFTIAELRELAKLSGLIIELENFYNYSPSALPTLKPLLRSPLQFIVFSLVKDSRECLSALCKLRTAAS